MSGRLKELIITAGGENIAPIPIEKNIKNELSDIVSYAIVIGDKRKHLSCLITLKCKIDPNGVPEDILEDEAKKWCQNIANDNINTVQDARNNVEILEAIKRGIDKANEKATANPHRVQKFAILPQDLSILGGELGPTLKIKRHSITDKYANTIDELYN